MARSAANKYLVPSMLEGAAISLPWPPDAKACLPACLQAQKHHLNVRMSVDILQQLRNVTGRRQSAFGRYQTLFATW